MAFFTPVIEKPQLPVIPDCKACGALTKCQQPKQTWPGKKTEVVIVVDRPLTDDPIGLLRGAGSDMSRLLMRTGHTACSFAVIPAIACRSGSDTAWKHCQPLLRSEIQRINPRLIIPFGDKATTSVINWLWGNEAGLLERWYGRQIPSRELNAWVCPIGFLGSYRNAEVSALWAYKHLRSALEKTTRPYPDKVPNYTQQINTCWTTAEIIECLQRASQASLAAIDYETTGLKPEREGHAIVATAVAWLEGRTPRCIAFRNTPEVQDALIAFLRSPVRKIAANLKYEERWSRVKLGTPVANWFWDTVLSAHILNPQKATTGLKFSAFAELGVPHYASVIEPYFETADANGINNIHQAPVSALLRYVGIDAIAELDLAILQMQKSGISEEYDSCNLPQR